jgi:acetyl-CoA synthetase
VLVTTDGVYRGAKAVTLKANADEAMRICEERENHKVKTCIA